MSKSMTENAKDLIERADETIGKILADCAEYKKIMSDEYILGKVRDVGLLKKLMIEKLREGMPDDR